MEQNGDDEGYGLAKTGKRRALSCNSTGCRGRGKACVRELGWRLTQGSCGSESLDGMQRHGHARWYHSFVIKAITIRMRARLTTFPLVLADATI